MSNPKNIIFEESIKHLQRNITRLKKSRENWNVKGHQDTIQAIKDKLIKLEEEWKVYEQENHDWEAEVLEKIKKPEFFSEISQELGKRNILFLGKFPDFIIPPFKLQINIDKNLFKLTLDKKVYQTSSLSLKETVEWIDGCFDDYNRFPFDSKVFSKELLQAYQSINNSSWGTPIPLKKIYELLTIKEATKQVYSESIFTYDLARLRESYEIKYEQYHFELAPHQDSKENYSLINSKGQESSAAFLKISEKVS